MASNPTGPVRVRFAPSPTGYLHVGGARTAIYNDLLRRRVGGSFILRIEDTDRERSDEAMIEQIRSALAWVGVEWDEGPVLQSAHVDRHRAAAERLVAAGKAYRCFVTAEELDAKRRELEKAEGGFSYRRCFAPLASDEAERRAAAGEPFVVRFRMPDEAIAIDDMVRGDVVFPAEMFDDFVILRSDGSPTYHLSVVVDDVEMGVTHVLRGDDHLSNTPKHVGLFRALGAPVPVFGHLPLILGPDKKRLSKRTGATSVEEFRAQGILPQALYNYLALLGWSPGGDRELMSRDEMAEVFSVERFGASAAVFDHDKLGWMNAQYMSSLPLAELRRHLQPFLVAHDLGDVDAGIDQSRLQAAIELHRGRTRTLADLAAVLVPYFRPVTYVAEACAKFTGDAELPARLEKLADRYRALEPFDVGATDAALRELAEAEDVKAGVLIHPTRMALTGEKAGPPLFDLVVAMGRDDTLAHLERFVAFLRAP